MDEKRVTTPRQAHLLYAIWERGEAESKTLSNTTKPPYAHAGRLSQTQDARLPWIHDEGLEFDRFSLSGQLVKIFGYPCNILRTTMEHYIAGAPMRA